ncbi:hypothetical protein [Kitasatospora sp. NPDC092286]|uniref:hypothetical protein n=1 Tax=Kitasatospora sp. NPDC092286 TaxID=3364087 RepID=UPI00382FEAF3
MAVLPGECPHHLFLVEAGHRDHPGGAPRPQLLGRERTASWPPPTCAWPPPARRVFDSAAKSFEIALHYQGDRDEQACAQALHNALAAAGSGVAAAALLRVADDPALGLDLDQWEDLYRIATELILRVVEDLGGER